MGHRPHQRQVVTRAKQLGRVGVCLLLGLGLSGLIMPLAATEVGPKAVLARVAPRVVLIKGYMEPDHSQPYAQASGTFLGPDGYLMSVSNLFTDPQTRRMCVRYLVRFADGRELPAKVRSVDAILNLAEFQLVAPGPHPAAEAWTGAVRPGDEVIALAGGMPIERAYAVGKVKARQRRSIYGAGLGDMFIDSYIQLPPNAYGGPLLDTEGRVIGITTPNVHRPADQPATPGEAHALPVQVVEGFLRMAKVNPSTEQNWLGRAFRPLYPDEQAATDHLVGRQAGIWVDFVYGTGPAANADVRPGDVLFSVNGKPVAHLQELDHLLRQLTAGDSVELALLRGGKGELRRVQVQRRPIWAGYVAWRAQRPAATREQ